MESTLFSHWQCLSSHPCNYYINANWAKNQKKDNCFTSKNRNNVFVLYESFSIFRKKIRFWNIYEIHKFTFLLHYFINYQSSVIYVVLPRQESTLNTIYFTISTPCAKILQGFNPLKCVNFILLKGKTCLCRFDENFVELRVLLI